MWILLLASKFVEYIIRWSENPKSINITINQSSVHHQILEPLSLVLFLVFSARYFFDPFPLNINILDIKESGHRRETWLSVKQDVSICLAIMVEAKKKKKDQFPG